MIHTAIETITPGQAREYLRRNTINRPLQRAHYSRLAQAMKRGEWQLNGDAIRFANNGSLLDGQHRLNAIALADTPIQTVVMRGLEAEVFATIDRAKPRSVADALSVHGEKNAATVAATARYMQAIEAGGDFVIYQTPQQTMAYLEKHPSIRMWASRFSSKKMRTFANSAVLAVIALGEVTQGTETALTFYDKLEGGAGMRDDDPAFVLRERLIEIRSGGGTYKAMRNVAHSAITIKAWNAFVQGRAIRLLRYNPNEQFPTML